jgi:transposase
MLSIDIKLSVINKYFVDGKGYKRIAKELNISRDTVRSTICRYRKQKGVLDIHLDQDALKTNMGKSL